MSRSRIASPWSLACGLLLCLALQSAGNAQEDPALPELDLQYVPAHQLEAVLRSDHPGVQLSASEFEELLRRAAQETQRRQARLSPSRSKTCWSMPEFRVTSCMPR